MRAFVDAGLECLIALSVSKSMGLYGERVGTLTLVASDAAAAAGAEQALHQVRPRPCVVAQGWAACGRAWLCGSG